MTAPIRILLVDDQDLVRKGFSLILGSEDDFEVVGEAADGEEAVAKVHELHPDVVLMDVQMPGTDGLEATRRVVADSSARVLVLTTFDREDYLFAALRAGASGFVLKNTDADSLVSAVRVIASGQALLSPAVTHRVVEHFARSSGQTYRPQLLAELTERELDVLRCLARGMSNVEIAENLVVSEATVKTHVSHILTKTGVRDRVQAVILAYESGLNQPGGVPLD